MGEKKAGKRKPWGIVSAVWDKNKVRWVPLLSILSTLLSVLFMILAIVLHFFFGMDNVTFFALGALVFCLPLVALSIRNRKKATLQDTDPAAEVLAKVTRRLISKSEEVYGLRNIPDPEAHLLPDYKPRKSQPKGPKKPSPPEK